MRSVHHLRKLFPNASQHCHSLRTLLEKNTKFIWTEDHKKTFQKSKEKKQLKLRKKNFNPKLETHIKCDDSSKGLGAALEQRIPEGF